ANQTCGGVDASITDFDAFEPTKTSLAIMQTLKRLYPEGWDDERSNRLLRNKGMDAAWRSSAGLDELARMWEEDLAGFEAVRRGHLFYED
ncbi:MAG: hypothetical protein ACYTGQ_10850, partial [Planctomycetota bacterium]